MFSSLQIFVALLLYNQKCYAFERMPNKHNLVQRYQFSENVRSSRQLLVIGIIIFIWSVLFLRQSFAMRKYHKHLHTVLATCTSILCTFEFIMTPAISRSRLLQLAFYLNAKRLTYISEKN